MEKRIMKMITSTKGYQKEYLSCAFDYVFPQTIRRVVKYSRKTRQFGIRKDSIWLATVTQRWAKLLWSLIFLHLLITFSSMTSLFFIALTIIWIFFFLCLQQLEYKLPGSRTVVFLVLETREQCLTHCRNSIH